MGLSAKQRYYNNLAKKGKITKAQAAAFGVSEKDKPKTTSKISSSAPKYSSVNDVYAKEGYMISPEHAEYLYKNQQTYTPKNTAWEASPEREAQKKSQSQREQAAKVVSGGRVAGASTSKPDISASGMTRIGKTLRKGNRFLGDVYGNITGDKRNLGLTDKVLGGDTGFTESKFADTIFGLLFGKPANAMLREDAESGGYYGDADTISALAPEDIGTQKEDLARSQQIKTGKQNPTTNYGTGFTTGYDRGGKISDAVTPTIIDSGDDNDRRTSSRRVSNPIFTPPQTSSISDILRVRGGSPQSAPDFSAAQTTDKTQRRFLGNGLLAKGTYGNGSGDYGMEGTFGDNQLSEEDSLLRDLFGIPTAKAAETSFLTQPNTNAFGLPYTGYSAQNGGMSTRYGVDTPPTFAPKNTSNEDYESDATGGYKPQATGGSGNGGVAQQYAQQGENPQEKYYKEAIKNAKKVMEEQIRAIKKQYGVSEESGVNALNKQKQEDLNALNARFSFGLNQDPNSEQAMQYAQRTSNDYAGQLSDFLSKLSASRTQDISSAKQNYYTQKNSAQEKLAQLMASLEEARINNAKKLSSAGTTAESKKQAAIMKLLNQAANMPSGGREYAQQIANIQGLGDISGYTPNGWENAYNPNFGQSKPSNVVSIGNGYVLDKDTGDVYQAYEE